jgi:hypothetical protein
MDSSTASRSSKITLFQKRMTWYPREFNHFVRSSSSATLPACWEPSSSMIRFLSKQAKSTIKGPIGICLRNLAPPICRLRRWNQSLHSASDILRRSSRANASATATPHPNPPPQGGRELDFLISEKEASIHKQELIRPQQHLSILHPPSRAYRLDELHAHPHLILGRGTTVEQQVRPADAIGIRLLGVLGQP